MVSTLKVNAIKRQSGTTITVAESGDTINVVSGATLDINSGATIDATGATITGFGGASDEQVKVSSDDTTAGFLNGKLTAGTSITLTEGSGGGDETLAIAYSTPATLPAASGVNLTALNATQLTSGKVPTAQLGTGTASSSTILYGDQTYKAEPTNFLPNAQPLIINGNMAISQRGTSSTGITGAGYKTVDRWNADIGGTPGTWTSAQEALTSGAAYTDGFSTALRWDCTTADGSLGASDVLALQYKFEGQDLQLFKKGTANAEAYTLAFWVKSNKTGTSQCNLYDGDNNRLCGASFTISSGDTWEHKVCNFAADTTGVMSNDNAESMLIYFPLAAGSNYTGGAIPTAWETLSNSDLAVSNLALADSTDNDFAITGIQLEVGTYTSSDLPPFRHESYGNNLERCQRYYYLHASNSSSEDVGVGGYYSSSHIFFNITFPCSMRDAPSVVYVSGTDYYKIIANSATDNFNDVLGGGSASTNEISLYNNTQVSGTAGNAGYVRTASTSGSIALNAEL